MFTFDVYISFFCRPCIFFSSFSTSFRQVERGRRNLEESIHNKNHWPQLPHVSGVECQIDRFACFAAYFSSFLKKNTFQSLENFRTINRKTEFPDFLLTDFPWLFPDLEKISFFPYFSLIVATLIAVKRAEPTCTILCRVPPQGRI